MCLQCLARIFWLPGFRKIELGRSAGASSYRLARRDAPAFDRGDGAGGIGEAGRQISESGDSREPPDGRSEAYYLGPITQIEKSESVTPLSSTMTKRAVLGVRKNSALDAQRGWPVPITAVAVMVGIPEKAGVNVMSYAPSLIRFTVKPVPRTIVPFSVDVAAHEAQIFLATQRGVLPARTSLMFPRTSSVAAGVVVPIPTLP
jgi:hypothetical protein